MYFFVKNVCEAEIKKLTKTEELKEAQYVAHHAVKIVSLDILDCVDHSIIHICHFSSSFKLFTLEN